MRCLLGEIIDGIMHTNEAGQIIESCWKQLPQHFQHVALDAFVIMPNHVHGIITLLHVRAGLRTRP